MCQKTHISIATLIDKKRLEKCSAEARKMIKFRLLAIPIGLTLLACLFGAGGQTQMYSDYPSDYPYNNYWTPYPYYSQYFYPNYYPINPDYYYPYYRYYYYPINRYYIYPFDSYPLGTFGLIAGGNYPIKLLNSLETSRRR